MNCKWLVLPLLLGLFAVSTGCTQVKPWQRGYLARPEMKASLDEMSDAMSEHILFSKEGSSGGASAAGGGCGCN